jgi:hypothetical protein
LYLGAISGLHVAIENRLSTPHASRMEGFFGQARFRGHQIDDIAVSGI